MYDATFFHYVSKALHEDWLREAARRYPVPQEPVARPVCLQPQLSLWRRLGQALWRAVPARLSSGHRAGHNRAEARG